MKTLRSRLECLERLARPPSQHLYVVCVDDEGKVLDNGSEQVRPWIGRHYSELPGPISVVRGIDPMAVLGLTREEDSERHLGPRL
jgi:hypothetical protein